MNWKNSYKLSSLIIISLVILLSPNRAISSLAQNNTFKNETLEYSIKWQNFVGAGTSTLSILNLGSTYNMESTTRSAKWLKYLGIRVKDVIRAQSSLELTKSYNYSANIQEGKYLKKKRTDFDHTLEKVTYREDDKPPLEFDLIPGSIDILSAIYSVRSQEFKVGESIKTSVFDEKKFYNVETLILKHETVDIGNKKIGAYKTKIILQTKGIFDRRGDIYIWFTDDERRIPIIIKSKVSLGSFYITITNLDLLETHQQEENE